MRPEFRKYLIASALGLGAVGSLIMGVSVPSTPAHAQLTVFDPGNYSQNILTAARTLQQVNNQIQSLQNQATMLINQAKNLSRIDFPQLQAITQTLQQIDRLMARHRRSSSRVSGLDQQFSQLYPSDFGQALRTNQQVIGARSRLDASMDAYHHTMTVQAQVVENVSADAQALSDIVSRSQGAEPLPTQLGQRLGRIGLVERDEPRDPAVAEILVIERVEIPGRLTLGKPRIVSVRRCWSPSFGSSPPVSGVSASTASRYIGVSGTPTP